MCPSLPDTDTLLPYLRRIDANRWYSNHGPLHQELTEQLSTHLGSGTVLANSGTSALTAAALARAGRAEPNKRKAVVPNFTFAATGLAAELCGYELVLQDVDPETWQLAPKTLLEREDLDEIGLVIPVGAMGRPVEQADWLLFEQSTGIPVVIDGAACFEAIENNPDTCLGTIPVAVSFHATKTFSSAEGGAVLTGSGRMAERIQTALNFGFCFDRESQGPAINGKMSEYHAAIGLASFEIWGQTKRRYAEVIDTYHAAIPSFAGTSSEFFIGGSIASCYVLLEVKDELTMFQTMRHLRSDGIETRCWYGSGLSTHPHFKTANQSNDLLSSPTLLGLPMALDLTDAQIQRIARSLRSADLP